MLPPVSNCFGGQLGVRWKIPASWLNHAAGTILPRMAASLVDKLVLDDGLSTLWGCSSYAPTPRPSPQSLTQHDRLLFGIESPHWSILKVVRWNFMDCHKISWTSFGFSKLRLLKKQRDASRMEVWDSRKRQTIRSSKTIGGTCDNTWNTRKSTPDRTMVINMLIIRTIRRTSLRITIPNTTLLIRPMNAIPLFKASFC